MRIQIRRPVRIIVRMHGTDSRWTHFPWVASLIGVAMIPSMAAAQKASTARPAREVVYREAGPKVKSVLHADGREVELETETVWRPVCGSDTSRITEDDLKEIARQAKIAAAAHPAPNDGQGVAAGGPAQFNLVFNPTTSLPATAVTALAEIEQYVEAQFTDPVTVTINFAFAPLSPGVLGATSSNYVNSNWTITRNGLIAGMDPDDTIQSDLPSGSTIPVRYDGNSSTVTNETIVFATFANHRATIGTVNGTAASMTFNSDFSWDYTPPNINAGTYCFQSVIIHEVGHALGFTSGADFRFNDMEMLDIYRFQRSDGSGDYNPDTLAEFSTKARMVDQNAPGTSDDVNSDLISIEFQMSDGVPNQASHFTAMNPGIYIMDPSLSPTETFYPNYFRLGDMSMFDAIGWDFSAIVPSCEEARDITCNAAFNAGNSSLAGTPDPPFSCASGSDQTGILWFEFVATDTSARISTCNSVAQDSTFAVYEGLCGSLVEIACSEDGGCGGAGLGSVCVSGLTVGHTYYIQLAAKNSASRGVYTVNVECSCTGACCVPAPVGCDILRASQCASVGGEFAGPETVCLGDGNADGQDDACETPEVKFGQRATENAEDMASSVDLADSDPNRVLADDFTSDGRPIRRVRWWGSVMDATVTPDGWFIGFHEPLATGQPAETALGLYFCSTDVIVPSLTPLSSCDPHETILFEVELSDCCLVHAEADSRSLATPAAADGFFEEECFDYDLSIQAVVGSRYDDIAGVCVLSNTPETAALDFWGWHTTTEANVSHAAYETTVALSGSDWLFGSWSAASASCSASNLSFELLTDASPAGDSLIWNNGPPVIGNVLNSQFGGEVTDWMTVDDFDLSVPSTIQGMKWTNEEQTNFVWTGRVRLEIYPDDGAGHPDEPGGPSVALWIPTDSGRVTRSAAGSGQFFPRKDYEIRDLSIPLGMGTWWIGVATEGAPATSGRTYWTTSHRENITLYFFGGESHRRAPSQGIPSFQPWSAQLGLDTDASFELFSTVDGDCNCNSVDDAIDIGPGGGSLDCNFNGTPDECEPDCDGNGIPDDCDISAGTLDDCQPNGIPDVCDLADGRSADCDSDGVPDECQLSVDDCNNNGEVDTCEVAAGADDCNDTNIPDECELAANDCNNNEVPDSCDVEPGGGSLDCNDTNVPDECELAGNDCNNNLIPDSCDVEPGGGSPDCNATNIPDECELVGNDCNNNLIPDSCDVAAGGAAVDCDGNSTLDVCELAGNDCNGNNTLDECDVAPGGASEDCNLNGVPDECDPSAPDCNDNGERDECDLITGFSLDCNSTDIPDECELVGNDCNGNSTPDSCDIAPGGGSADDNGDLIPDECCAPTAAPLVDTVSTKRVRFLRMRGGDPGRLTALRVKLVSLQDPVPPNAPESPPHDLSAWEGQVRWVGPPVDAPEGEFSVPSFRTASLQCTPHFMDWSTESWIEVYGKEIVPSSLYEIQTIEDTCAGSLGDEGLYSAPTQARTTRWGDVVFPFNPPDPTTQPDFTDISSIVDKFKNVTNAPVKARAMLQPSLPDVNAQVSFLDISACVDAFKGIAYPFFDLPTCPP